ncbi:hypothetical protein AVEN_260328-1 [Araneus ventricosus]|uniref:Uncharacterized protein n=1 Tax=Araneus ventricosus TaxID=182803 RepID=A0A4Y2DFL3_ARAVE|nr:hypothetical protein AVEN_260328-1 [Araneus ventricosus]
MFPQNVAAIAKPSGYWNQGHTSLALYWNRVPLLSKVEPQYLLRVFVGFGSPRKDGRNCIPLCRKGAVLVRDGYIVQWLGRKKRPNSELIRGKLEIVLIPPV